MTSVTLNAPAKVNLFLKILRKRKDGYHDLSTLFERISLSDRIKITKTGSGIEVITNVPVTDDPRDNLVYRAAESLMVRCRVKHGVSIKLDKRTPIAAGMGGGSSDAAAVLIGIKKLFKLKISGRELARIGEKLGADIPFFLMDTSFALGEGKGTILRKVRPCLKLWHLIIYPGFKVPTKDIYTYFDKNMAGRKSLTKKPSNVRISPSFDDASNFDALENMMYNDLESTVSSKYKAIAGVIRRLARLLGKKAIVSGSGPSVFCLYRTRKEAIRAKKILCAGLSPAEKRSWQVFVAETF